VTSEWIRNHSLRHGQWIQGKYQESNRGPQLIEITSVNDMPPETAAKLPHFDELKAINPNKRIAFETTPDRYTTRVVDIVAPVGRGQRGLIVSPPRSGKTTLLLHMAEAIREKYDEQIHLMILLVDERPEEVTEFRRALPGAEIYASSNDEAPRNHTRIAELAIERAKRLVEAGKDVFLLMDSITRLARAYNNAMSGGKAGRGRATGSGGITIGALEIPRRLFAAARNTREAGSLTILATALIQTNSRADEAIFMEFKGTGNMELVLDRKIAESYVYPAVDIFKSGTRREELLLPEHTLHKIHLIRRGLSGHRPYEAMERLLYFIKKFPNNPQMLLEIKG
jgi:transcription termination factor Rho